MHTTWSDGALSLRELVDLYGRTGDFDVIAITDHILREKDWLGRAGRLATLGRRTFSVTEKTFPAYLDAIREEAERAWREYELLVIPGAEVTKNHSRARKNAHIIALGIDRFISADQSPEDVLRDIRRQGAISVHATRSRGPASASSSRRPTLSAAFAFLHPGRRLPWPRPPVGPVRTAFQ